MIPSKTLRSLNIIRNLAGVGDAAMAPHAAYMKITTLELEKLRLNKAREHATRRICEIDGRLRQLEQQKIALLRNIDQYRGAAGSLQEDERGQRKGLRLGVHGAARLTY